MSHDSHDSHHGHSADQPKIKTAFSSSFWLIVILVGLFVAALNFIQAETEGEEHDHSAKRELLKTGAGHTGAKAIQSANAEAHEGEHHAGHSAEEPHEGAAPTTDSAHPAGH